MTLVGKELSAEVLVCTLPDNNLALEGVASFLRLKNVTNTIKECDVVLVLAGVLQCNGGKLEEV